MFYQFHHIDSPNYLKLERAVNFSFPLHLHQCYEIVFLLSGTMDIAIDGQVFTLVPGKAVIIFPNQIHSLQSDCSEHFLCIFSPRLVQAYSLNVANSIPQNNLFDIDEYLQHALMNLEGDTSTAEKKGVLYSICAQFHRQASYVSHTSEKENLLRNVFRFVENNFSGECTLASLAADLGYDYSYLSRFFKKSVGMSFNAYVNHYRLSHACYLMEDHRLSILSCALDSGYTSMRSFNRNFKQSFHITPAEYRKNLVNRKEGD